jgi:hypothetical protein
MAAVEKVRAMFKTFEDHKAVTDFYSQVQEVEAVSYRMYRSVPDFPDALDINKRLFKKYNDNNRNKTMDKLGILSGTNDKGDHLGHVNGTGDGGAGTIG